MKQINVLLLFGGESTEHDVSLMSAQNVVNALDRKKFNIQLGYISRTGRWFAVDSLIEAGANGAKRSLVPLLGESAFGVDGTRVDIDVILSILHGKNGEDGSVQALAQLLHIPIVGCDMLSSAVGMDKVTTKRVVEQIGIQVVPYVIYRKGDVLPAYETLVEQLGPDMFVKPSRAGSSVGAAKVSTASELKLAIQNALQVDTVALIERALEVRELELGVLGVPPHHEVSCVGEILPGEDFYSYQDKYSENSLSSLRIPALLSDSIVHTLQEYATDIYRELGCSGLSRIDFFLASDGQLYFNEINTIPGFTSISMYPKLWQHRGLTYPELITRLIMLALE